MCRSSTHYCLNCYNWGHIPSSFYRMPFCSTSPRLCRPSDMTRYVLAQLPQEQDCAVTKSPYSYCPILRPLMLCWEGGLWYIALTVSYGWAACSRVPFVGLGLSKSHDLPESGCCPRKVARLRWTDKRYVLITLHRKWQQPGDINKTLQAPKIKVLVTGTWPRSPITHPMVGRGDQL